MDVAISHKEDKRTAITIAILLHVALFILFLFIGLTQPDPLPEEFEIPIAIADFGDSDVGSGDTETEHPSDQQTQEEDAAASTSTESAPEEITTQDAPSEASVPQITNPDPPKDPKPETPKEKPKPTVSTGLKGALAAWKTAGGGTSGDGDSNTPGNQGLNTGKKDGAGTLQGTGYSLSGFGGRGFAREPKVTGDPKENGKVVLNVCTDREGNVTKADYNMNSSTTNSSRLINMAKKAAKGAKFKANPTATFEQCGKLTFNFKLK